MRFQVRGLLNGRAYQLIGRSIFIFHEGEQSFPDHLTHTDQDPSVKVFGPSPKTRTASGTLLAISAAGNIMSATYAAVRGECYRYAPMPEASTAEQIWMQ